MNHWQQLLSDLPHTVDSEGHLRVDDPAPGEARLIPRTDLAVIRAHGGDWRKLLQGQTTCDLNTMAPDVVLPGALCTPKGRVVSNFHLLQRDDDVLIITHVSAAAALLAHLGKFAPFFRVTLEQQALPLLATLTHPDGIAGLLHGLHGDIEVTVGKTVDWNHGRIAVISGQQLLVTLDGDLQAAWQQLTAIAAPGGTDIALLAEIRDGLARVTTHTIEEFIPQMIGLHHTGAVSFKKGCYTGQEVVARMQYLGKLKRHLCRMELDMEQPPRPGTPCYLEGATGNCGHVVLGAPRGDGAVEALLVVTAEGADSPRLQFGEGHDATAVRRLDLPFRDEAA